ncbi:metallophosphoesterase [Desulforamulus ferrireducens]|uniref:Calcineurin-like phosphoesterase domain-containing protein n=1 Tax=Desulforamulus ferrireducens TaxID=1833852 RepID=A0A1S6IXR3_9FIRM|nr:metallophosphoesterase [Desulforamulus ferrireducens]AQS59552.1 hypothetical protein B0537_10960 [Desulforamulus ferrireducens]
MRFNLSQEKGPFDIIGDVHGCLEELQELLALLGYRQKQGSFHHPEGRKAVYLGDLGDRGPHCLDSIKTAMKMVQQGDALYVPGNHCKKLNGYLTGRNVQIKYGLEKTVEEFLQLNATEKAAFTEEFTSFYQSAAPYLILDQGNLVVAHAGIKEHMIGKINKRIESFCLYGDTTGEVTPDGLPVRLDWAEHYRGKALIVYGHTPVEKPQFKNNTIDIDTGCAMGGHLTALRYPEREILQVAAKAVYYVRH